MHITIGMMENSKGRKEEMEFPFHTTLSRSIRPDLNWNELMERWQTAITLEDMLSVLHRGFRGGLFENRFPGERVYDQTDRLIFYFAIADGWEDSSSLRLPGDEMVPRLLMGYDKHDRPMQKAPCELRQVVAQKAFDMLCLNYFKTMPSIKTGHEERDFHRDWENVASERLFPVIQRFFRVKNRKMRNLSHLNDRRSHNEWLAAEFVINLAKFIWEWREYEISHWSSHEEETKKFNMETRFRLDASKPWTIEILSALGRLDVLQQWMFELDKECLKKLKEIAMSNKFSEYREPVRENRPVASLDEACYLGSPAAWFLKEHELRTSEHKRLLAVARSKQKIKEAEEELKKLAGK